MMQQDVVSADLTKKVDGVAMNAQSAGHEGRIFQFRLLGF